MSTQAGHGRVLLVDDDEGLLRLLSLRLEAAGHRVSTAASGEQALAALPRFRPEVVVTDLRMDRMDGMTLFDAVHERNPALPVIILTAHGTIPDAVEATRRGVFAYLTKPFDAHMLLEAVERALRLSGDGARPAADADGGDWRRDIISRGPAMTEVLAQARLVADSEANVLIQSESGTGKELLARAIHRASGRAAKPFLAVNCSAIPETLLESELFGHARGSFTGATHAHKGLFEAASGGTLFLDEVGDLPIASQAKLLRVLQEREVRPVGSTSTIPVDVRVISATHRDLEQAVANGEFREDLFYRLNVVRLDLPPLRDRREDIPLLVAHFLARFNAHSRRQVKGFSPDALEALVAADWPGNVRQLQNVVEQTVVLATTEIIPATLVRRALRQPGGRLLSFTEARDRFERGYLSELLQITEGNVKNAARIAGRNRTDFYKLLKRHGLEPDLFRPDDLH